MRLPLLLTAIISLAACTGSDSSSVSDRRERPPPGDLRALLARFATGAPAIAAPNGFTLQPTPHLRAELGSGADDALRIVASPGGAFTVHRHHAQPAGGRVSGGAVVYEATQPGTDTLVFATHDGVEELVVARAPGVTVAYDVDLPATYSLHRTAVPGLVEIRDTTDTARLRLRVDRAWDASGRDVPVEPILEGARRVRIAVDESHVVAWPVVIDPEWTPATTMTIPRFQHTATLLPDGRVLIAGGDSLALGLTELFDPRTGTFTTGEAMTRPRATHTATLLPSGEVLLAGGTSSPHPGSSPSDVTDATDSAEVFDPRTGIFAMAGALHHPRAHHTATLLAKGRVFLAGGFSAEQQQPADAEIYDGATLASNSPVVPLTTGRGDHAAVPVEGTVVLIGGHTWSSKPGDSSGLVTIEVVDPDMPSSSVAAALPSPEERPAALRLPSGEVLIAGASLLSIFDPGQNKITVTPPLSQYAIGATLLPSGRVLLTGGQGNAGEPAKSDVKIFDPGTLAKRTLAPMTTGRMFATATLLPSGQVLLAGGYHPELHRGTASAELYDPGEPRLESTGSMLETRVHHTMSLLSSGEVLVAGGGWDGGARGAEIFDPTTETFRSAGPMITPRERHAVATLPEASPKTQVLVTGGYGNAGPRVERYDHATGWFFPEPPMLALRYDHHAIWLDGGALLLVGTNVTAEQRSPDGFSQLAAADVSPRFRATATKLVDGRVLVAGGRDVPPTGDALASAGLFGDGTYTALPPIGAPRAEHTATLLDDGSVVIVGGSSGPPFNLVPRSDVIRFDPAAPIDAPYTPETPLLIAREGHTATLLDGGKILVTGGADGSAELYDTSVKPATTKMLDSHLPEKVIGHVALSLSNGQVLLTGGGKSDGPSAASAIYDGKALVSPTDHARAWHTATLLPSGDVLRTGGIATEQGEALASADRFDPRKRSYTTNAPMSEARLGHTATLVDDGQVVVAGGQSAVVLGLSLPVSSTFEIHDGKGFGGGGPLSEHRSFHAATRLADGRVLLTGGRGGAELLASAEIIDPGKHESHATKGSMLNARHRHTALRLPSGRVLIAGGITIDTVHPYDGEPISPVEIYDPGTDTFTVIGSAPIPGDARAVLLPSGEALVMGEQIAYRFDEATGDLSVAGSAPLHSFGAAVLPGGQLLVCGLDRCDLGTGGGIGAGTVIDGVERVGHSLTALPSGELIAFGLTPGFVRHTFSYRPFPPDVPRPVITHAPSSLTAGEPAVITGSRFQRMSARGTPAARPPLPHILPQMSFIPSTGGSPVTATPTLWSDTSITFIAPHTPFHGGGFLVVLVDGVPSEGAWVELLPAKQGTACALDGECASGHCADGVCCDQACASGCLACRKSENSDEEDGICRPIDPRDPPRFGCEQSGSECASDGRCDGAGDCHYPSGGKACVEAPKGHCIQGTCIEGCKSNVQCGDGLVCLPDGACAPPAEPEESGVGCSCSWSSQADKAHVIDALLVALGIGIARRRRGQKA